MMRNRSKQKDSLSVEQVFDVSAKRYDSWYDKPFGKSAFVLEKACIESLCKNLKAPFLEVGVGTGRFARALKIEYGTDLSIEMLKYAKQRVIAVTRGEGERLPFVDSFIGAVFIIVTLCFVDDPMKVLKEASRVLNEDGAIILGLILKESPWADFYREKGEAGNIFYKIATFYSFEELKSMVEKAGLKIVKMSSTMFQAPTEIQLRFKSPKSGYYEEAGFVALKIQKANPEG